MKKYDKFHEKDVILKDKNVPNNEDYCTGKVDDAIPFLSFPITKTCNHACDYCGVAGEATASQSKNIELHTIRELVGLAKRKGITKFRITGGEPFKHPKIREILSFFNTIDCYILVNTNGSLILENKDIIDVLNPDYFRFSVSLDTLNSERFKDIAHPHDSSYELEETIKGIEYLQSRNLLQRINMVVGSKNYDEVLDMIHFCQKHNCQLKLLDIVSVPVPFGERQNFYKDLTELEDILKTKCDGIGTHNYTQSFGIPCFRYKFDNIFVTLKNTTKGSHYDSQICISCCNYYPCHEGLYDIFALSDGRICACRWTEKQFFREQDKQLDFLINAFKKSVFMNNNNVQVNMKPREDLNKTK